MGPFQIATDTQTDAAMERPGRRRTAGDLAVLGGWPTRGRTAATPPLLSGDDLPDAWCREDDEGLLVFFADPTSRGLKYALVYNQSERAEDVVRKVVVHAYGHDVPVELRFAPHQSLLLRVGRGGAVGGRGVWAAVNPSAGGIRA